VRERTHAAVVTFLSAWLLLGLRIWLPRRWITVSGLLCLALAASLAYSVHVQLEDENEHPIGVMVASEVVVRTGDGETYEPQFNRALGAGIEFRVREQREEWLQIELPDGKTGWVRTDQTAITAHM
jgi:SH3-like domain-containing protein